MKIIIIIFHKTDTTEVNMCGCVLSFTCYIFLMDNSFIQTEREEQKHYVIRYLLIMD